MKSRCVEFTSTAVAILLLAVSALALWAPDTISAKTNRSPALTGVSVTASANPGELDVSWDAHPDGAEDHRVSWAPSNENFRTWTDTDWNAFPTGTSYTITGLSGGEEYKVRVRARFQSGPSSQWSGILTATATAQSSSRASAPTGVNATGGTNPGELDVSWDAHPNGAVDHRVSWAPSNENFRGWRDTGWNAFPTGTSYTITGLDGGEEYKVKVRARFQSGPSSLWSGILTATAKPENSAPTGQPGITGTAQVGETLTADTSGISDANGLTGVQYSYQWVRTDGSTDTTIPGATGQTYTLTSDDQGKTVKVSVSFTDDDGYSESLTSAATGTVDPPPNVAATGLPTITGTAQVGETLSADTSGISDTNGLTNPQYTYQWIRYDGSTDTEIPGATDQTYTLTDDDLNQTIKVSVSFNDDDGYSESLTSAATGTVDPPPNAAPNGLPTITGTAQVGETLSADTSGISDGNGLTNPQYTYQWIRTDGSTDTTISGATGQIYTLTDDDFNQTIKVSVSFTDDDGYSESLTSAATGTVDPPPNVAATGLPTITGTAQVGETLSADTSGISDTNGLTNPQYTYQWIRYDGSTDTEISGATAQTYTLTSDDQGKVIKVQVGFTDDDGYSETLTSAAKPVLAQTPTLTDGGPPADPPVSLPQQHQASEPLGQDLPADTTTTGTITVGGSAIGIVGFNKDVDWWKVTLQAGKAYGFSLVKTVVGSTEDLHNPYLHGLYDSLGALIPGTQDDNHGPQLGAYFHFKITTTGTYYVATGGVHTGYHSLHPYFTMGGYELSISDITDTLVDDYVAGTGTSGTVPVGVVSASGSITGSHTVDGRIETSGDEDWFKVTLTAGNKYMIDLMGADTIGGSLRDPLIGGVYDRDGSYIANTRTDDGGFKDDSRLVYTATESGDHFIRAEDDYGYRGQYRLSVLDVTAGWPDDYSADTSTTGTVAVDGSMDGNIEVPGDRDWIKVTLTAGVRYRFELQNKEFAEVENRLIYYWSRQIFGIHNPSGDFIDGTTGSYTPWVKYDVRIVFTPTETGDHYIDVGGAFPTQKGEYILSVQQLS